MLRRRKRSLPPGLARAKFVRLGFLRKMISDGKTICRRQDLPEEAFGDPTLAAHLIIVSHKWFHPHRCDIFSSMCPQGVKFASLIARLEENFSKVTLHSCR